MRNHFRVKILRHITSFNFRSKTGELSALSHKCTHYGAPLIKGVLENGRVRCPWHGACFNAKTGDIEDFPGIDSLQRYKVSNEYKPPCSCLLVCLLY